MRTSKSAIERDKIEWEARDRFPLWLLVGATEQNEDGLWIVDKEKIFDTKKSIREIEKDIGLFEVTRVSDYGGLPKLPNCNITIYYELIYENGRCVKWFGGEYDITNKKKLSRRLVAPAERGCGQWVCGKNNVEKEFFDMKNRYKERNT